MKYKRLLTLVLAAALCIVAAACGTKNNAPGTDTPTTVSYTHLTLPTKA